MIISTSRWSVLQSTLAAWIKTGFPFLGLENGCIVPIENFSADDPGLNYCIPFVAKTFNLPLEQALWWWDSGIVVCGALIASVGFWYLSRTILERVITCVGIIGVAMVCCMVGDVYIVPFFNVCLLPWLFVVFQKSNLKKMLMWAFCAGLMVTFTNFFRMYVGFTIGIAGLFAIIFFTKNLKSILFFVLAMGAGIGLFQGWFYYVMHQRNVYLAEQHISYGDYQLSHVFWHSLYAGLGFLQNDYGILYSDTCACEKAKSVNPDVVYCSLEYNQILKIETIKMCLQHPNFFLRTLFAKMGVLFYYLLLFANFGLLCAWFYRKPWWIECAYWSALWWSSLSGLLTVPIFPYLTGFFTVAAFYGIHSIMWALQKGLVKDVKAVVKNHCSWL